MTCQRTLINPTYKIHVISKESSLLNLFSCELFPATVIGKFFHHHISIDLSIPSAQLFYFILFYFLSCHRKQNVSCSWFNMHERLKRFILCVCLQNDGKRSDEKLDSAVWKTFMLGNEKLMRKFNNWRCETLGRIYQLRDVLCIKRVLLKPFRDEWYSMLAGVSVVHILYFTWENEWIRKLQKQTLQSFGDFWCIQSLKFWKFTIWYLKILCVSTQLRV